MPPLVLAAAAWLAGLVMAHHWLAPAGVRPGSLMLLALIPLAAILLWRKDPSMRLGGSCALALLLGAFRYQLALPNFHDPAFIAYHNSGGWLTIEGVVRAYPDVRDTYTDLRLASESVEIDGHAMPVRGTVLVRAPRFPECDYGDRLLVSGFLETPPEFEGFSYRDYLARQGIYALVRYPRIQSVALDQGSPFWAAIYAVRDRANGLIARLVPDPEASLLQGILLGIESGIPASLYDDYNATGTSHIIVISGTNITILAALFARTFGRLLGKRRAYWFTLGGIILYVLLVGADAAVVRAGIMGTLYVTARYLGRQSTAYVSLFASAILLTLAKPLALWDAGFQLSFAATLGLILFTPPIERLFERALARLVSRDRAQQILRYLSDVLVVTLAAQVLTIPLVVYHFGRLVLVSPLANALILPVQPLVMSLGGVALLVGMVPFLAPAAQVIAWVPWLCLAYTNAIVRELADWPMAAHQISHSAALWLLCGYSLLLGLVWLMSSKRGYASRAWQWAKARQQWQSSTALVGLGLAAILAWLAVAQMPDGRLHVTFLDVGQGDAILITTPRGQQLLVDGGPSPSALTSALGREMPFWDRSLDLVAMTHADADHITGLAEVLDRYQVGGWLESGLPEDDPTYVECQELLAQRGVPQHSVSAGDRLNLGSGILLDVLHPPAGFTVAPDTSSNDRSLVLRLAWQHASFLFTGDVEAAAEGQLLASRQLLRSDVLKVAHHGSGGSSTVPFLAAVDPGHAVISVGAENRFGHPDPAVLERLAGVAVLRTDQHGTVEFATDGQRLWVRVER
jgi:competence protein ComEC